jgi:hypothetical protein
MSDLFPKFKIVPSTAKVANPAKLLPDFSNFSIFSKGDSSDVNTLSAAKTGDIKAYSSIITIAECVHANGKLDDEVKRLFRSILTSGQIIILVQPDIL